jgi:tetratricopeptide (TPR) repeat protein
MRRVTSFLLLFLLFVSPVKLQAAGDAATQPAGKEAFLRKNILDAYETVGRRDPKWDDTARKVLALAVRRWMTPAVDPDLDWQIWVLAHRAIKAGCDDPMVFYFTMRAGTDLQLRLNADKLTTLVEGASDSKYAPFLKVLTFVHVTRYVNYMVAAADVKKLTESLRQGAYDNIPGMMADPDFPPKDIAEICSELTNAGLLLDGDRKPTIDKIHDIMTAAQPDSLAADLFLADAYLNYAWDARGGGAGNTVTDDAQRAFTKRLEIAQSACEAAMAKAPHSAAAPIEMLSIELGPGISEEMEKYFRRAIADDPDALAAYNSKLYFLHPKWYGSIHEQLDFGRVCLATKKWDARIPFLLLESHRNMVESRYRKLSANAQTVEDRRKAWDQALSELYAAQPATWQDVRELYEGYFVFNPKSVFDRINYAKQALLAGQLDVAVQQYDILDANPDPIFKSHIALDENRVTAAALLTDRGLGSQANGNLQKSLPDLQRVCTLLPASSRTQWYAQLRVWMVEGQLGEKVKADGQLQRFLAAHKTSQPTEWPAKIGAFLLDQLSETELVAAAQASDPAVRSGNVCEAWYYAGKKQLIAGDKQAAAKDFQQCIDTNMTAVAEYQIAKIELARLES